MDTPALERLMGAYFHQDFHDRYGGVWETLTAFLAEAPEGAGRLPDEISWLLSQKDSEAEVEAYLDVLGCQYLPQPEDGGYRGWLIEIARRAADATGAG